MTIEIFVHQLGKPTELIEFDAVKTVLDLAVSFANEEAQVLLEGSEKPLDPKATLEEAGIEGRCHIHISSCTAIAVKVRFNSETIEQSASPSVTARTILDWAIGDKGFDLPASERPKYILRLSEEKRDLNLDEHVGSVADEDCSVLLDLAPDENFQG